MQVMYSVFFWKEIRSLNIVSAILILVIPGSILIDLLNGFFQVFLNIDFSIGVLYRGFFLVVLLPVAFLRISFVNVYFWALISLYFFCFCIWGLTSTYFSFSGELVPFFRIIYLHVLLLFLMYFRKRVYFVSLIRLVVLLGSIASLSIIFSFFTGIGIDTYGSYTFGVKSFFKAQNDMGVTLLISLVFSIYSFFSERRRFFLIYSFVITIALFLLGTRAGIGGAFLVWISFFLSLFLFKFRSSSIPTSFRKWIVLFSFILISIFLYVAVSIISQYGYMLERFSIEALAGNMTRSNLIDSGTKAISQMNWLEQFFGQGWETFHRNVNYFLFKSYNGTKQVEVDYFDLLGSYGFLLGGMFVFFPLLTLAKSMVDFFKSMSLLNFSLVIGMFIYCGHSFYAGHVINSPTVSTVASVLFYLILSKVDE